MSERGSFVTEYIYCEKCLDAVKAVLCAQQDKFLWGMQVPGPSPAEPLPIIAGKIGDLYAGGERDHFETTIGPLIEKGLCHPVRVAVLGDVGEEIFQLEPMEKTDD